MGVSRSSVLAMAYMVLVRHWALLDVVREFRKRRDVRPNDDFIDQIVALHNEFLACPSSCLRRQNKLWDLPRLARPWHYEYWREPPDQADLPFTLTHLGDTSSPASSHIAALNTDIVPLDISDTLIDPDQPTTTDPTLSNTFNYQHILLASSDPFKVASDERAESESESEWEYYTETESEPET